jgi:hypothetical protein
MLFMMLVKGSKAEHQPDAALEEAMDRYNEELVAAGVRIMAKGLHPDSEGIRVSYPRPGEAPVVTHGPFGSDDPVAGFFLIDVKSKEEAVAWAVRVPDPIGHGEGQVELRQVYGDRD